MALPARALRGPLTAHRPEFFFNLGDPFLHAAAVGFQLRFTFAAHPDAAFLPREVAPKPREPWQQMLKLREFNLEFAFARAGALRENVEDERGAVEHFAFKNLFQVAALS